MHTLICVCVCVGTYIHIIYIHAHTYIYIYMLYIKNVKWSRYRTGVAQRVGRGIALLFRDRGTRRGWVFSSTPRPHFTPGKDPVPILQEAGWAPGPVLDGRKILSPPGFDPGPSSPQSVAIPTELPGPHIMYIYTHTTHTYCFVCLYNIYIHTHHIRTHTHTHTVITT